MYSSIEGKYEALKTAYNMAKRGKEEWKAWFSLSNRISTYYMKTEISEGVKRRLEKIYQVNKAILESEKKVEEAITMALKKR